MPWLGSVAAADTQPSPIHQRPDKTKSPGYCWVQEKIKIKMWSWELVQTAVSALGHIFCLFFTGLLRHTVKNLPSSIIFLHFVLLNIASPLQAASTVQSNSEATAHCGGLFGDAGL